MRIPTLGREAVFYARCFRHTDDFEIEIVAVGDGAGLLHWRVGLHFESRVRARGVTYLANGAALLRALRDAYDFVKRNVQRVDAITGGVVGNLSVKIQICRACWRRGEAIFAVKDPN